MSSQTAKKATPTMVYLDEVEPLPVEWWWKDRIPSGMLTTAAGDGGKGKSLVTLDLAARMTRGAEMPDGSPMEPGAVVFVTCEDDHARTVVPRLIRAGADRSRIAVLDGYRLTTGRTNGWTLDQFDMLGDGIDSLAERSGVPVRAVVIDPIAAYFPKEDDAHNNAKVRGLLAPLQRMAAERQFALIAVAHMNKAQGGKAAYRIAGSTALINASRAAYIFANHPDVKGVRVMLPVKANITTDREGFAYRILGGRGEIPAIEWLGEVEIDATAAMAAEDGVRSSDGGESRLAEAEAWLEQQLANGPVPEAEIRARADRHEIRPGTLKRAKNSLGVRSQKATGPGGRWTWALPDKGAQTTPPFEPEPLAPLAPLTPESGEEDVEWQG